MPKLVLGEGIMPRRWYQTIELEGVDAIFEDIKRKNSRFWNEGNGTTLLSHYYPKSVKHLLKLAVTPACF